MKITAQLLILIGIACNEEAPAVNQSIVDSNTISTGDSTPAILHLDNAQKDSTFTVAMDSLGPAVKATDTTNTN